MNNMALKDVVSEKIMNQVLRSVYKTGEWKVLVVDQLGMRLISSCCKMHEITAYGVTLVEDIRKKREALTHMEAIYLITPTQESVRKLTQDFSSPRTALYRACHVFFTQSCPDDLFRELAKSSSAKYMKTLKEMDTAFLPYESQIFSLDSPQTFQLYYKPNTNNEDIPGLLRVAEQLATLCLTLNEYPNVRYRSDFEKNHELAQLLQDKLDAYKEDNPTMGDEPEKLRSQLIVLDRGFDCTSPLVHELTFQAMAYDVLDIVNDVYRFKSKASGASSHEKEVFLDENDEIWRDLRHKHIAVVLKSLKTLYEESIVKNIRKKDRREEEEAEKEKMKTTPKDLSEIIKKLPEFEKKSAQFTNHFNLADECLETYQRYVEKLCRIEQDLALGTDSDGQEVKNPMISSGPILLDQSVSKFDKIRIMLLYIISKGGVSEETLKSLLDHGQIPPEDKAIIANIVHLGLTIIDDKGHKKAEHSTRKIRPCDYKLSRWTPLLKDLMEDAIEGRLDQELFPYLKGPVAGGSSADRAPARPFRPHKPGWYKDPGSPTTVKKVPRLIIFIAGGMTFSEMRVAYEVTKNAVPSWEVIIGSGHILTPRAFLEDLRNLDSDS